jgi:DNA-binding response OmpR family regulator
MEKNKSILIVENNKMARDMMGLTLNRFGYDAIYAHSSEEIYQFLHDNRPALIILDLFIPQESALTIIRNLRNAGVLRSVRLLVVSSLGFQDIVEEAKSAGAHDFLLKPFDTQLFIAKVQGLIG